MHSSDLHVERLSDALSGWSIDVVVSGSIGAVEAVRFIRALRRLSATVTPWLTSGGAQFATPLSLTWASGREVCCDFSGNASHIACQDACIVAPASASIIGKVANGITDSPASALIASYLGQGRPVLMLPNMHGSLAAAPGVTANMKTLKKWGIGLIEPRREEGKAKFPKPDVTADECAHLLKQSISGKSSHPIGPVLITMGSTRGYIDDVRYVSNYSSGKLGSLIAEELYRHGFDTDIVSGASQFRPRRCSRYTLAMTNDSMREAALGSVKDKDRPAQAVVLAASVLDFTPSAKSAGKLSSKDHAALTIELRRTPKIIADLHPPSGIKVGFKLESGLVASRADEIAIEYMTKYGLSMIVINDLADVDENRHKAVVFETVFDFHDDHAHVSTANAQASFLGSRREIYGKHNLALIIANHVRERLEDVIASKTRRDLHP